MASVELLRRYSELPYVLQMLQTRRLTLLNPSSWDDKNDSHYVQAYRERKRIGSVLALCLTEADQTYHHWRVFTHGSSGACVCFDKERLLTWISEDTEISGRYVLYRSLGQIRKKKPTLEELPFLKRMAYEHEQEFRLLYTSNRKSIPVKTFPMPLNVIDHILVNPWLSPATCDAIENVVQLIPGCEDLGVYRATIVQNDEWQQVADGVTR
jgi:hypothetical protein